MKTLRLSGIGILMLFTIAFLSSCNDDDPTPNRIVIDGTGLSLNKGYLYEDDDTEEDDDGATGRYYTVILTGSGLELNTIEEEFEGKGDLVYFVLFSPSTDELEAGTYEVNHEDDLVGTFGGFIYKGFDIEEEDIEQGYEISSGSITVKKSGDKYTLSFDFKVLFENSDGFLDVADVTGQYSGILEILED